MQCDPAPLQPTWSGHVASTTDALILFEGCLQGRIKHLSRRPYDRERLGLIQSGNVFIYEEFSSGIKRWTDGRHWSPSRVLGNFLVYRELRAAFQPGMTRKVTRPRRAPYSERRGSGDGQTDAEYALIGPLVDSYPFKPGGLVKKIIRVVLNGVPHHLVAYYTLEDVENGRLTRPPWDPALSNIIPRRELVFQEGFRVSVDQEKDALSEASEWYAEYNAFGAGDGLLSTGATMDALYATYSDDSTSRRSSLASVPVDQLQRESTHQDFTTPDSFYQLGYFKTEEPTPLGGFASMHTPASSRPTSEGGPPPSSSYYPLMIPPAATTASLEAPCPPALAFPDTRQQGHLADDHHRAPFAQDGDLLIPSQIAAGDQGGRSGPPQPPAFHPAAVPIAGYPAGGYPMCGGLGDSPLYGEVQPSDLGFSVTVG